MLAGGGGKEGCRGDLEQEGRTLCATSASMVGGMVSENNNDDNNTTIIVIVVVIPIVFLTHPFLIRRNRDAERSQ